MLQVRTRDSKVTLKGPHPIQVGLGLLRRGIEGFSWRTSTGLGGAQDQEHRNTLEKDAGMRNVKADVFGGSATIKT